MFIFVVSHLIVLHHFQPMAFAFQKKFLILHNMARKVFNNHVLGLGNLSLIPCCILTDFPVTQARWRSICLNHVCSATFSSATVRRRTCFIWLECYDQHIWRWFSLFLLHNDARTWAVRWRYCIAQKVRATENSVSWNDASQWLWRREFSAWGCRCWCQLTITHYTHYTGWAENWHPFAVFSLARCIIFAVFIQSCTVFINWFRSSSADICKLFLCKEIVISSSLALRFK